MRITLRTTVAGVAIAALVGSGAATAAAAATAGTPAPTAARQAAGWLGRQFYRDGDLRSSGGEPGIDDLPLAIVSLAAAHVGARQVHAGIAYLEHHAQSFVELPVSKSRSVAAPGRLAEVILAAVAAKADPRAFGGTKPADNFVARLRATQRRTGSNTGLFGSAGSPTYSTAYTQGLALVALAAVKEPNRSGAGWLVRQQCANGGWEAYRSNTRAACAPVDLSTYTGPDTNSTALAIEGLVATKVAPKHHPLAFLAHSQYPGGGFGYFGTDSRSQAPDPDSTAVVAQALADLHRLGTTTRDGHGAEHGLAAFRLGCAAPVAQRGAYRYPGVKGANLFATIQAIPAVAGEAYPIGPGTSSNALPTVSCTKR